MLTSITIGIESVLKVLLLKGAHVVDGHNVFFDQDGKQIKGDFASDGYYYSKNSGDRVDLGQNHYQNINNNWYYIGNDGKRLTGEQVIDGVEVYFDSTGKQVKGNFAENDSFYDKDSGARLKEQFVDLNGKTYYVDAKGKRLREGEFELSMVKSIPLRAVQIPTLLEKNFYILTATLHSTI